MERRALERLEARHGARRAQRAAQEAARDSPPDVEPSTPPSAQRARCGALTRKGLPCQAHSEPGRRRCRFHGGKSTGPRTAEGVARIAEAQRKRWAVWRASMRDKSILSSERS
nr:HGGxSTG domain-containing protein [Rubellimicrobium rubrum]